MTNSPQRPRAGIIGTGGIAHAHADALKLAGAELVAAVDIDPDRATEFAQKVGVAQTAPTLAAAAEAGLDLVAVCTPPSSHAPLALEALALGMDVVLEKPPALSLRQFRELQEAERATGKRVSCIFQHRFGTGARKLADLQESGALGSPLTGFCNTLWFRDHPGRITTAVLPSGPHPGR
jgi:predicted dehydrogenase